MPTIKHNIQIIQFERNPTAVLKRKDHLTKENDAVYLRVPQYSSDCCKAEYKIAQPGLQLIWNNCDAYFFSVI